MWKLSEQAQNLVQQLHDLLSSKPWFARSRHEDSIISILGQIADREETVALGTVARCLFLESRAIRMTASRTVHRLLSVVSTDQLIHLSGVIGCSWGWYISDAWDKLSPSDVTALLVDIDSRCAVLGLLSFHRNGYVRQEAVRLLCRMNDGTELPFLLIRQNDWVPVIGVEAQEAVNERLRPDYLLFFVRNLSLVSHLLAFERRNLSPVFLEVVEMLLQPQHDALLAEVVGASTRPVRRQVVRVAFDISGDQSARVIRHGLGSSDPIVRLACAKRVRAALSGDELRQAIGYLQHDRSMPVRREGVRIAATCFPGDAVRIWERALLDPNASIRELARYSRGNIGAFDAANFYRQNLAEKGVSFAVVCGLAECGDTTDLRLLRSLTTHPRPKFKTAAIRGLARIGKQKVANDLVEFLKDESSSVIREAARQLEPFSNEVCGETLYAVLGDGITPFTRQHALRLIFGKGKWESLPWLIRAATHPDEWTASQARRFVEAWFSPPLCNRVFTKPSFEQRQAIETALSEFPRNNADQFLANLEKWVRKT